MPLEDIVANINMDMIGRNARGHDRGDRPGVLVARADGGRGGAAHPELGLAVGHDRWPEERFFFRSDHYNFARKEIPAIFFFAGVHDHYHQPSDEVELIDVDKAARVARLVFLTAHTIATTPQRPQVDRSRPG